MHRKIRTTHLGPKKRSHSRAFYDHEFAPLLRRKVGELDLTLPCCCFQSRWFDSSVLECTSRCGPTLCGVCGKATSTRRPDRASPGPPQAHPLCGARCTRGKFASRCAHQPKRKHGEGTEGRVNIVHNTDMGKRIGARESVWVNACAVGGAERCYNGEGRGMTCNIVTHVHAKNKTNPNKEKK